MKALDILETMVVLLFGAIVVGIVLTNPRGVTGVLEGLGTFNAKTVGAFAGPQGFVRG